MTRSVAKANARISTGGRAPRRTQVKTLKLKPVAKKPTHVFKTITLDCKITEIIDLTGETEMQPEERACVDLSYYVDIVFK